MFAKIEHWLTLGGQYTAVSVIYVGLALILGGTTLLDLAQVGATGEPSCSYTVDENQEGRLVSVTYDGCPEGQQCCGGECISADEICCEDGTHGNAETCGCLCCGDCGENTVTTLMCDE